MRNAVALLVVGSLLGGCARPLPGETAAGRLGAVAVVPSPYEPAAQFEPEGGGINEGAVIGAAGGAGIGAMSAKASAGLLCTIGGPLCLIVVIPAAIVGGLVGGVAGGVVDALTTDPGNRIAKARDELQQAIAEMRLTDAMAVQTRTQAAKRGVAAGLDKDAAYRLEVGVSELQILPREKEMALALRARSRLYRTSDGALIEERVSEAQTGFRKYQDWAADGARPLRLAVDRAIAELSTNVVREHFN